MRPSQVKVIAEIINLNYKVERVFGAEQIFFRPPSIMQSAVHTTTADAQREKVNKKEEEGWGGSR